MSETPNEWLVVDRSLLILLVVNNKLKGIP